MVVGAPDFYQRVYPSKAVTGSGQSKLLWSADHTIASAANTGAVQIKTIAAGKTMFISNIHVTASTSGICRWALGTYADTTLTVLAHGYFDVDGNFPALTDIGTIEIGTGLDVRYTIWNDLGEQAVFKITVLGYELDTA